VESAEQMRQAMRSAAAAADVVVMAAAVADFRPVAQADRKLKKRDGVPEIGRGQAGRPGSGGVRGRDRRPARQRSRKAAAQTRRPAGSQ
jgi:phosphopantothenoylcysteine synthetase/decarboxylase